MTNLHNFEKKNSGKVDRRSGSVGVVKFLLYGVVIFPRILNKKIERAQSNAPFVLFQSITERSPNDEIVEK